MIIYDASSISAKKKRILVCCNYLCIYRITEKEIPLIFRYISKEYTSVMPEIKSTTENMREYTSSSSILNCVGSNRSYCEVYSVESPLNEAVMNS